MTGYLKFESKLKVVCPENICPIMRTCIDMIAIILNQSFQIFNADNRPTLTLLSLIPLYTVSLLFAISRVAELFTGESFG